MVWAYFNSKLWDLYDRGGDSLHCPECGYSRPALKMRVVGGGKSGKAEIELQCGAGHTWKEVIRKLKSRA